MKIDKVKTLTILVVLLLIINVVTIAGTWRIIDPSNKKLIPPPPSTKDYIVAKLGLNESQQEVFESLRIAHFEEMNKLQQQILIEKEAMFDLLKSPLPDTAMTYTHIANIMQKEERLEHITFEHFRKVRAICNDEQKQHFDAILEQIRHTIKRGQSQHAVQGSGYGQHQPLP